MINECVNDLNHYLEMFQMNGSMNGSEEFSIAIIKIRIDIFFNDKNCKHCKLKKK